MLYEELGILDKRTFKHLDPYAASQNFPFLFWISVICFKTTFLKLFYLCICITETNAFRYELKTNVEINMLVVYLNSFPNILISDFLREAYSIFEIIEVFF